VKTFILEQIALERKPHVPHPISANERTLPGANPGMTRSTPEIFISHTGFNT
jgi:hypothetical protein